MKDKLLVQSRSQHQSAVAERDSLRIELGKLGNAFRSKQDAVDEQVCMRVCVCVCVSCMSRVRWDL